MLFRSAAYTAGLYDSYVEMTSMTAGRTVTLPSVTGILGKLIVVKHSAGAQTLTIQGANGQFVTTLGTLSTTVTHDNNLKLISTSLTAFSGTGVAGLVSWGWTTF